MVSAKLTVVPQMARISSGSSDGATVAERSGAEECGISRCAPSEFKLSASAPPGLTPGRRVLRLGVRERDEWISPRLFFGVLGTAGLLI